ncbi:hypothetical protein [Streptomyces ossamyceticus]|uniref:hypothetical protein n=1 Tax=Streptomyces ossamyceticus TaxID=249581 RepID=UPI00342B24B0
MDHTNGSAKTEPADTPQHDELYLSGCSKDLPAWGVTRQFDFGQFVLLHQVGVVGGTEMSLPLVVAPDGSVCDVDDSDGPGTTSADGSQQRPNGASGAPRGTVASAVGGVPLSLALTSEAPVTLVTQQPAQVRLRDLRPFLDGEPIQHEGTAWRPLIDNSVITSLLAGRSVNALAEAADDDIGARRRIAVRLVPEVAEIQLDEDAVDLALATGEVQVGDHAPLRFDRDGYVDFALRTGQAVQLTARPDASQVQPIRLLPATLPTSQPLAK